VLLRGGSIKSGLEDLALGSRRCSLDLASVCGRVQGDGSVKFVVVSVHFYAVVKGSYPSSLFACSVFTNQPISFRVVIER
jgi:hypothetical protein